MCDDHASTAEAPTADASTDEGTSAPAASSCCGGHAETPAAAPTSQDQVTTCPVVEGTPVVKATAEAAGLFRDYEGTRYWFCCAACGPLFDADPAKYAAA